MAAASPDRVIGNFSRAASFHASMQRLPAFV